MTDKLLSVSPQTLYSVEGSRQTFARGTYFYPAFSTSSDPLTPIAYIFAPALLLTTSVTAATAFIACPH